MLKVLISELTSAPRDSSPCMLSQGFPFFELSFLVDLLKPYSKCLVWIHYFLNVLGLEQALAADGSHTGGMDACQPAPCSVKVAHGVAAGVCLERCMCAAQAVLGRVTFYPCTQVVWVSDVPNVTPGNRV